MWLYKDLNEVLNNDVVMAFKSSVWYMLYDVKQITCQTKYPVSITDHTLIFHSMFKEGNVSTMCNQYPHYISNTFVTNINQLHM